MLATLLEQLLTGTSINPREIEAAFATLLDGHMSEAQTAGFLTALRAKGEEFTDLAAGADAMRARATPVNLEHALRPLSDNCGTGGDGSGSFNISTTSAIVAASMGLKIAKHGNRSISSKCGSADLLFRAGYPEKISAAGSAKLLKDTGFTFFFAPNFHPAMKHVGPVRKALGIRTIFNLLGPLANPIAPDVQLIGVGAKAYLLPMAQAAAQIGIKVALVVHSRDGMDEVSPSEITDCVLAKDGIITEFEIDPKSVGLSGIKDLSGGDADTNVAILNDLLDGKGDDYIDAVSLNAATLLWINDVIPDLPQAFNKAREQISSGKTKTFFHNWITAAKACAGEQG